MTLAEGGRGFGGTISCHTKGEQWILVLTDHFTRWQDALTLPDATAPVVANALDEGVFCYLGLPEQIHTDQGAQFESQLTEAPPLCDGRDGQHANVGTGAEVAIPAGKSPPPTELFPAHEHALEVQWMLQTVHEALQRSQMAVRQEDKEEPLLYTPGNWVWLMNKRRRRGENPKLQAKFVGSYQVLKAWGNQTYLVERQRQSSIQSEERLKLYHPCPERLGQAPATLEPRRGPNMKGARPSRPERRQEEGRIDPVPIMPP
ncbi:uncharacterized protein [Watersipora subatra]|uniref:uncharacterized protein n=1 Tax=Watersipora subatra TaxID=2589382 RepID=UPI00355BC889